MKSNVNEKEYNLLKFRVKMHNSCLVKYRSCSIILTISLRELGNSTVLQTGVLLFKKYPQIGICDILINIAMRILRKKAENLLTVAMLIEEPWKFTFVLMSNEVSFKASDFKKMYKC